MKQKTLLILLIVCSFSCQKEEKSHDALFQLLSEEESGITFRNDLTYTEKVNPYTFRNFYNGSGVALGDINNDGLTDVFLARKSNFKQTLPEPWKSEI